MGANSLYVRKRHRVHTFCRQRCYALVFRHINAKQADSGILAVEGTDRAAESNSFVSAVRFERISCADKAAIKS